MPIEVDELIEILTQFHREVLIPDLQRVIDSAFAPLRNEMLGHFDAIYKRFDRLESEYRSRPRHLSIPNSQFSIPVQPE